MKKLNFLSKLSLIAIFFAISCTSTSEDEDMMNNNPNNSSNVAKNTALSSNVTGELNHFVIQDTQQGYITLVIHEKQLSLQNSDWGNKIDFMIKELPTQNTTFNHRVEPDFNLQNGEYYFNTANLVTETWYSPFINSRPTAQMTVTIDNGIATFTVENAELSDNFVAPITATDNISVSFSIPVSGFTLTNNSSSGDLVD